MVSKDSACCVHDAVTCKLSCLHSLLSHAGVFQDVHVDEERLLVFTHPAQEQSPLLQQALGEGNQGQASLSTLRMCQAAQNLPPPLRTHDMEDLPSNGKSLMSLAGS